MEISNVKEFKIADQTFLEFTYASYPNIRATSDATNLRLTSGFGGMQDIISENIIFRNFSGIYIQNSNKFVHSGNYFITETDQGIEFLDFKLNSKLLLQKNSNSHTIYYFDDIEYYAIVETKTINSVTRSITRFYDKDLCFKVERVGNLNQRFEHHFVFNGRFFDVKNKYESVETIIRRYNLEEIVAKIDPTNNTINYYLRKIVFSENECAVCMMPLVERYCIVPCGHTNICGVCLKDSKNKNCSICRSNIASIVKIVL
jgi:parallel beta-helix repeat protein